jgi:hypothetical protein
VTGRSRRRNGFWHIRAQSDADSPAVAAEMSYQRIGELSFDTNEALNETVDSSQTGAAVDDAGRSSTWIHARVVPVTEAAVIG